MTEECHCLDFTKNYEQLLCITINAKSITLFYQIIFIFNSKMALTFTSFKVLFAFWRSSSSEQSSCLSVTLIPSINCFKNFNSVIKLGLSISIGHARSSRAFTVSLIGFFWDILFIKSVTAFIILGHSWLLSIAIRKKLLRLFSLQSIINFFKCSCALNGSGKFSENSSNEIGLPQ